MPSAVFQTLLFKNYKADYNPSSFPQCTLSLATILPMLVFIYPVFQGFSGLNETHEGRQSLIETWHLKLRIL